MSELQQEQQVIDYKLLENGIHLFKFTESSRRAVDAWIIKTEELTAASQAQPDKPVRYLYDQVESGMQPAYYAFQRSQAMLKNYPGRARSRAVFLINPGFFVSIMDTFIKLLRSEDKDKVQFFPAEQYDQAIAWLLRDD